MRCSRGAAVPSPQNSIRVSPWPHSFFPSPAGPPAAQSLGPVGAIAGRSSGALGGNVIDQALFGPTSRVMSKGRGSPTSTSWRRPKARRSPRVYGRARLVGPGDLGDRARGGGVDRTDKAGGKGGGREHHDAQPTATSPISRSACARARSAASAASGPTASCSTPPTSRCASIPAARTRPPIALIVAKEGEAPAYRGLAYVVFERLPLEKFGNRIPQLSFEVMRPIGRLETMVRAVTLIPGTTEFGYETATIVQVVGPGQYAAENRHVAHAVSDIEASLDDLQAACPNLERVALVVAWFGTDLRAGECEVKPGVETARQGNASRRLVGCRRWTRATRMSSRRSSGRPAYGWTPSDASVIHLIAELKTPRSQDHALSLCDDGHSGGQHAARSMDRRGCAAGLSLARAHHLRSGAGAAWLARRHRGGGDAGRRFLRHRRSRRLELSAADPALRAACRGRRRRRRLPDRLGAAQPHARALGLRRLSGGDAARRAWPTT